MLKINLKNFLQDQKQLLSLRPYILTTYGHCGLDWMTSLLDNHKQILIMPSFSFFRCLYYIKTWDKNFSLDNQNIKDDEIVKNFTRLFSKDIRQLRQRRRFLFTKKHYILFKKYLSFWLHKTKITDNHKKVFYGIHYAFSKIYKIDLRKKNILVCQEHVSFYCNEHIKMHDVDFIFMVRDPRAAIAGSILRFLKHNSDRIYSNQFDHIILIWKWAEKFVLKKKINNKIYVSRNESMHKDLKKEMSKLSKWLNIKFTKSLIKQTVLGRTWYGESAYLQGKDQEDDLKKYPPKKYYYPKEIQKRWKKILSVNEIKMIEVILKKIFKTYDYKFIYKQSIFSNIKILILLLLNYNYQKKYFLTKYLIVPRNIFRRILILIEPFSGRKISRFH